MGKTREKSRGKNKNSLGIKIFLVCLVLVIVGLAVAIIIIENNGKENSSEMSLEEYYNQYYEEVDKIYDDNPDNIMKVVDYFTEKAIDDRDAASVRSVAMSEIMWFKRKDGDNVRDLLNGLVQIDYSELTNIDKMFYYDIILNAAKETENNSIVEKYTPMKDDAVRGYLAELEMIKRNLENDLNGSKEELPKEVIQEKQKQYDEVLQEIKKYEELYD